MPKLEGKVAVITGGSTGIGLATAEWFVAEGAQVVITGRRPKELDAALSRLGPEAVGVQGDVANLADLDRLYDEVKRRHGRVDVLFANAGISDTAPIGSVTEDHYDRLFGVNVKGLLFTVQKALPLMPDGASVILNASVATIKGFEGLGVYSATKAAVRSFARSWTADLKARGIRVNALSPGPIDTPILDKLGDRKAEVQAHLASLVPLARMGEADEIAKAAVFLASDDGSFVAGIELFVDGGLGQV